MKTASPTGGIHASARPPATRCWWIPNGCRPTYADPHVRVVEVDVSPAAYDDWHIDGAVLWNVYADLKDADYRLVDTAALERLVARSGIGPDSTVVFYGYAPALGLWLMKLYGHPRRAHPGLLTRHLAGRGPPVEHRRERTGSRRLPARPPGLRHPGGPGRGARGHRPAGNHPGRRALNG